mmetsp:Transcript_3991/g.11584  ORF Transcript_3991/g.11584 Transcript_3991/m.11584 type:complete len:293 (-) Transcript_3991:134-1012(-)
MIVAHVTHDDNPRFSSSGGVSRGGHSHGCAATNSGHVTHVGVLEGTRLLVAQHVQRHLAAVGHDRVLIAAEGLQQGHAGRGGDGAQGLRRLVAHHGMLSPVLQHAPEHQQSSGVLHLPQHVRHLVLQQRTARPECCPQCRHGVGSARVAQGKHGGVPLCNGGALVQQLRPQLCHGGASWRRLHGVHREVGGVLAGPRRCPVLASLNALQRQLTRLCHLQHIVILILPEGALAFVAANGSQRLCRLMSHHGVLLGIGQDVGQQESGGRLLPLPQAVCNLMTQQRGGVSQSCSK